MKKALSYKSKRNIIIASVIVILLAGISTAGYFYIKGNDKTSQAFTPDNVITGDQTQNEQQENTAKNDENVSGTENQEEIPDDQNQQEQLDDEQEQNNQSNTNQNQQTSNNGTTGTTTEGEVPNQDFVVEEIEEKEVLVSEDYKVEWTPTNITANTTTANLNIIRPIITAKKLADKTVAVPGETITYTILVENSGKLAGNVTVLDTIPTGTTFVAESIKINGETAKNENEELLTAENLENGITVNVPEQNENGENGTVEITFQVTVNTKNDDSFVEIVDTISNMATIIDEINEVPTDEVKTSVVTSAKTSEPSAIKAGEKITYTITLTNAGEIEGTVTVKDTVPTNTTFVDGSIKVNGEPAKNQNNEDLTADDLANGITVNVPAKDGETVGTTTVTFEVTVNTENTLNDGDKISNTAYVNEKQTNTTETEYNKPVLSSEKEANKATVVPGEELTYTITVTNTGKAEGTAVVKDTIPTGTTFVTGSIKVNGEPAKNENNEELTADDLANGITINVPEKNGEAAGKTTVSFTVKVNEGTVGTLSNKANVNNTPTEEVKTPVFVFNKKVDNEEAKVGDDLTYTITVENTGKTVGTVKVIDPIPEGTQFIEKSIKLNGEDTQYTKNDLETNGINVTLNEAEKAEISFKVKVLKDVTSTISNIAYVNEIPSIEILTKVKSEIKFVTNGGTEVNDMNGYTGENIDDRNMPTTTRTGYTFKGWYAEQEFKNIINELPEKYPAGTTIYYAKWEANTNTKYKVEYYYQVNGEYTNPETPVTERTGTTDTEVSVTDTDKKPTKTGYVLDANNTSNVFTGNVAGNGSLVLKVYFKQQFTVTYKPGTQGTFTEQKYTGLDYGTTTPTFDGTPAGKQGYTFKGWEPSVDTTVTGNKEYVAQWEANTNTKYTVEYYYQENGEYTNPETPVTERTGTTDTEVSVTDTDKKPTKTGYVLDANNTSNVFKGNVVGDGSLVLKVYFKQQFTVTYKPGTQGTFTEQKYTELDYGTTTPTFDGTPAGKQGYTFKGWTPSVDTTVTGNKEYVAQWEANTNTKYTVEYYYQVNGEYTNPETPVTERTGTTDTEVSVTETDKKPTKTGYVLDANNTSNVFKGNVVGDGSLVLKVYFKQQFTVTYKPGTQGTFTEQKYTDLDYGTTTPAFDGTPAGNQGYTFNGWNPSVDTTVTGNKEYVAQWKANTNTKYTVEYYYQVNGEYTNPETPVIERIGTTDTEVSVTDTDKEPIKTGYVLDESNTSNVFTGNVAGNGSLVLKVYFKQQFTVTYKPGKQGTFTEQKYTGLDYGTTTPTFDGTPAGNQGYTFNGWNPSVDTTVTGNKEYVAQWKAVECAYVVKYYYENENGEYAYLQNEDEPGTALYGATITTFEPKDQSGKYTLDHVDPAKSEQEKTKANLVITDVNGNNVLNVYYKRNSFEYTIKYYKELVNGTEEHIKTEGPKSQKLKTEINDSIIEKDFSELDSDWKNAHKPSTGEYQDGKVTNSASDSYYIEISDNAENNVIKVVYKLRTDIPYTINYYYNEERKETETISGTAKFGAKIENQVIDKSTSYGGNWTKADKSTTLPYTIKADKNIINVYYVKPDITVTKSSSIKEAVEVGSTITYTIKAENNGYLQGTTAVTDDVPAGTEFKQGSKVKVTDSNGTSEVDLSALQNGITLNVPARNSQSKGVATIEFTVTVKAAGLKLQGNTVSNTATYKNAEDKNSTNTATVTNKVEKTVNIKCGNPTITNSNIILVIDTSYSMSYEKCAKGWECKDPTHRHKELSGERWHYDDTKINAAKQAAKDLIDQVNLSTDSNKIASTVTVISFNGSASKVGSAKLEAERAALKTAVENMGVNSSTNMKNALNKALEELNKINNSNKNIVIFLSDGTPTDSIEDTTSNRPHGETVTGIRTAASNLKTEAEATVYTIGFGSDADTNVLQNIIATDTNKYYAASNGTYTELSEVFTNISMNISGSGTNVQSTDAVITLENVNSAYKIKINGTEIEYSSDKIVKENDTTYNIILSKFTNTELEGTIEIIYYTNR